MSVFLRKSEWLDDWYVVDGCSAMPEGTAEEWQQVIEALKSGKDHRVATRIAVRTLVWGVEFYSPRNSCDREDSVQLDKDLLPEWIAKAETLLKTEMHCVEGGEGI